MHKVLRFCFVLSSTLGMKPRGFLPLSVAYGFTNQICNALNLNFRGPFESFSPMLEIESQGLVYVATVLQPFGLVLFLFCFEVGCC